MRQGIFMIDASRGFIKDGNKNRLREMDIHRIVDVFNKQTEQPNPPDYPSGLRQREVEVLRLLALGKSNREIGDELVITEGTVRRHVSNVYDKIGVSNRTEATRYALREGLVSSE